VHYYVSYYLIYCFLLHLDGCCYDLRSNDEVPMMMADLTNERMPHL
jgi:hypothetical protein